MLHEFLYIFGNLLTSILVIGLFIFSITSFYNYYIESKTRKQMHVLEAKISMLRMLLKSKIRQRVNKFQQRKNNLKKDERSSANALLDRLKEQYEKLDALEFNASEDFNTYFDLSHEIILDLEENLKSKKPNLQDRWSKLLFYDKKSVIIIVQIVKCIEEFRLRAQRYNESQKNTKKHFNELTSITIVDFETLQILLDVSGAKEVDPDSDSTDEFEILNQKKSA